MTGTVEQDHTLYTVIADQQVRAATQDEEWDTFSPEQAGSLDQLFR
jgi:hypothetical protein